MHHWSAVSDQSIPSSNDYYSDRQSIKGISHASQVMLLAVVVNIQFGLGKVYPLGLALIHSPHSLPGDPTLDEFLCCLGRTGLTSNPLTHHVCSRAFELYQVVWRS